MKSTPSRSRNTSSEKPEPFMPWESPADLAQAIQKLHHMLLCGEISQAQAMAHVSLLRLYIANMYLNGPVAILPALRPHIEAEINGRGKEGTGT